MIIDNPVYTGKIAFGRRTREKIKGTKNEYRQVHQDEYIIADGRDRAHLLSSILKCPKCSDPMYTNKHAWTNKDGTYKEIYYYVCSKARTARGKNCDYKAMLKKTDIEPLVIEAIRELEEKIEDVKLRHKAVEQDAITLENIYTLLANFNKVYDKVSVEEKNP